MSPRGRGDIRWRRANDTYRGEEKEAEAEEAEAEAEAEEEEEARDPGLDHRYVAVDRPGVTPHCGHSTAHYRHATL